MPRRLSNIEWATFLTEVNVPNLDLPPWGGIVDWHGQLVLVYVAPSGEVFTTDVTDMPRFVANVPKYYDSWSSSWIYQLPQAVMSAIVQEVGQTGQVLQKVAESIGEVTAAVVAPIVQPLTPILLVLGIIGLVFLFRRA